MTRAEKSKINKAKFRAKSRGRGGKSAPASRSAPRTSAESQRYARECRREVEAWDRAWDADGSAYNRGDHATAVREGVLWHQASAALRRCQAQAARRAGESAEVWLNAAEREERYALVYPALYAAQRENRRRYEERLEQDMKRGTDWLRAHARHAPTHTDSLVYPEYPELD
jgi:hypothetical protein